MTAQGPGSRKNNPDFERTVGPNGGVGYRRVAGADRSRAESIKATLPPQGSVYEEDDSEDRYWERAKEVAGELDRLSLDADFTLIDGDGKYIDSAKAGGYVADYEDEGYPLGVYARYPLYTPGSHGLVADANMEALTADNGGRLPDHWRSSGDSIDVPVEDLLDAKNPNELQFLTSIRDNVVGSGTAEGYLADMEAEAIDDALSPEVIEEEAEDVVEDVIAERLEAAEEDGAPESVQSLPDYDQLLRRVASEEGAKFRSDAHRDPCAYIQDDGTVWFGTEMRDRMREAVSNRIDGLFR